MAGVGPLSVGLASGIDYGSLIEKLINAEKRPLDKVNTSISKQQIISEAYGTLNSLTLTARLSMSDFASIGTFRGKTATSSDENALSASANTSAATGSYSFIVNQLAQSSQQLSSGRKDQFSEYVGAGTLTFEVGGRRLDRSNELSNLNNGEGVALGKIVVSNGISSQVFDLKNAVSLDDVFSILNDNTLGFSVGVDKNINPANAAYTGLSLAVKNSSASALTFSQSGAATTLVDLGLSSSVGAGATVAGSQINYVDKSTRLSSINDGNGISATASGTKDIRFYVQNGSGAYKSVEVDLYGMETVGDVIETINLAIYEAGLASEAKAQLGSDRNSIAFSGTVTDVQDINSSRAAYDLGLTGDDGLVAELNSTLLRNLNGGQGIAGIDTGAINIQTLTGDNYNIDFYGARSVHDVIRSIETATSGKVDVSINNNGNGLNLQDLSGGTLASLIVTDRSGTIAEQLGIETSAIRFAAGYNITTSSGYQNVLFVSDADLGGIAGDDLIGRSVQHTFGNRIGVNNGGTNGLTGTETTRIMGFKEDPDALLVESSDAAGNAVLSTVGPKDIITDLSNLGAADSDFTVGSLFTLTTSSTTYQIPIIAFDSATGAITLADTTLSSASLSSNDLEDNGYNISYRSRIILENPDATEIAAADAAGAVLATAAVDTLTDAPIGALSALQKSQLINATLRVVTSNGTVLESVITSHNGANQITLADTAISVGLGLVGETVPDVGYSILYPAVSHGQHNGAPAAADSEFFLSDNSGDPDVVTVVGSSEGLVRGRNLENRMISRNTLLANLNGGKGISKGSIKINTSSTSALEIDLTSSSLQTVGDLIDSVKAQASSITVEINSTGDGLRIYDNSGSTSGITVSEVNFGLTAKDLNLLGSTTQTQLSVDEGADYVSAIGTDTTSDGDITFVTASEFIGLDRRDVIGSIVSYRDDTDDFLIYALATGYDGNSGTIQLTAHVFEDGSDATAAANNRPDGQEISLMYRKDFQKEGLNATVTDGSIVPYDPTLGIGTLELDPSKLVSYDDDIVGSLITIVNDNGGSGATIGQTAMITNYDATNGLISYATANDFNIGTLDTISISTRADVNHRIRGSATESKSFKYGLAGAGFISMSGTVNSATTTSVSSSSFSSLDRSQIIGALISVTDTSDSDREGDYAVVTGYDAAAGRVYFTGGWSDASSSGSSLILSDGDAVAITYASELKGTVMQSTSSSSVSLAINANATNSRSVVYDNLFALAGVSSTDGLIGSTLTFTTANSNQNEKRTIVDVIQSDKGGADSNKVTLVLDRDLPATVIAGDAATLSSSELRATITSVDFARDILETTHMQGGLGDRAFALIPSVDGSYQKDIAIESTDTLDDVANKINNANAGVRAAVINDGNVADPFKISLSSERSGIAGGVSVSSTVSGFDFAMISRAQDAKIIMGDASASSSVISSSTNSISNAVSGLTLNLLKAGDGVITVNVDNDSETILDMAKTFTEDYNKLMQAILDLTALETTVESTDENGNKFQEKQKGILFGDTYALQLKTTLQKLFTLNISASGSSVRFLSDIGFNLDSAGNLLEFDDSVLGSKLTSDFDRVRDLLVSTPNIMSDTSLALSSGLLQNGFDVNNIRNGKTGRSGFSEAGGGTNGIKLKAGETSKSLSISTGGQKTRYGIKLYHYFPEIGELGARRSITATEAAGASLVSVLDTATSTNKDVLTDATNLAASLGLYADQLVGATIQIGTTTATVDSYDVDNDALIMTDTALTTAGEDPTVSGYTLAKTFTGNIRYNYTLQYYDSHSGSYKDYRTFSDISNDLSYVVFPGGLDTSSLRLIYDINTGESEDFSDSGHYARLLEVELLDNEGVGRQINRLLDGYTNAQTGVFQEAAGSTTDVIKHLADQASRLQSRIESKEAKMIKDFQNLELVVSNLNSQSSFLQSQLSGLSKPFSYKNGG
ncbi:MAG: flagellar filament capping protein FliD [Planctomycetes bacterium]|nr:flagellar filament capping protein FliD [Planctomycetota bacterium]